MSVARPGGTAVRGGTWYFRTGPIQCAVLRVSGRSLWESGVSPDGQARSAGFDGPVSGFDPVVLDIARARVRGVGARVTMARVRVLAILMESRRALSHHDIESRIGPDEIDRVTVYRVLDWLVESRLVHRLAGSDRAWRFATIQDEHANLGPHGHFQCNDCGRTYCLGDAEGGLQGVKVPGGFGAESIDLTGRGTCADCGGGGASISRRDWK